jgi:16S rRNA (cytosine1402-N4)-methyltransferase
VERETRHIPVLLPTVLEALNPRPGQVVVDCTVGLGGHACPLLDRVGPSGCLIGFDLDAGNLALTRERLQKIGANFQLHHTNFAGLPKALAEAGIEKIDGLLADLGVASPQIDDGGRGFSYRLEGPLDMRMDPSRGRPASVLVNSLEERELAEALRDLGDEEDAAAIARLVVERRRTYPIETTQELTAIVCEARGFTLQRAAGARLHPAARTFQVLRMLVNRELANLQRLLDVLPEVLRGGAAAAIISFHSGEDRLVKHAFKRGLAEGVYSEISADPITADLAEQKANPRSRSAKLRWARTLNPEPSSLNPDP